MTAQRALLEKIMALQELRTGAGASRERDGQRGSRSSNSG
jgi:hypothetical protein